jgi:hypothetical protein
MFEENWLKVIGFMDPKILFWGDSRGWHDLKILKLRNV